MNELTSIDYITYIFTMAGLGANVLLPSSIQFIINVVMTVPALIFVDRWGRRPTLLVGAFLMMTWLVINAGLLGAFAKVPGKTQFSSSAESMYIVGAPSKAVIACTYLFVASYAPTWGPISWIYPAELYPLRVRGKAVALCTSANWIFNFALAYFVPPAFANIRWEVYVVFAVFCAAMFLHVLFLFPETSQKPLEEVEEIFDDTTPGSIRFIGTPAWKTHIDTNARRLERGEMDAEEKFGMATHHNASRERAAEIPKTAET
jgi:MFS family permease